jgi:peptidoglycan hydrolase-like protein with peptidoglycan-binding domain
MTRIDPAFRPTLMQGDDGPAVAYMQSLLPHSHDGDFGPVTDGEVREFQRTRGLTVDGVVGPATWDALESHAPPVLPEIPSSDIAAVMMIASMSAIADYSWHDRGEAPIGYVQGIALSFAQTYQRLRAGGPAATDMAKANTHDDDTDALSWYNSNFQALGMSNETAGPDTLRHLYVLLMGLGMRESSGRHCEGRDMSASNVTSDTAEAGLYQTSYNAHVCSPYFDPLMDEFAHGGLVMCFAEVFSIGVSCSDSDWACYGSGRGYDFQSLCKHCPAFAVESCALVLRNLRQHYGPINRKEAEIRTEADDMFRAVQAYVDRVIPSAVAA